MEYQVICVENTVQPMYVGRPIFGPASEEACEGFMEGFAWHPDLDGFVADSVIIRIEEVE